MICAAPGGNRDGLHNTLCVRGASGRRWVVVMTMWLRVPVHMTVHNWNFHVLYGIMVVTGTTCSCDLSTGMSHPESLPQLGELEASSS